MEELHLKSDKMCYDRIEIYLSEFSFLNSRIKWRKCAKHSSLSCDSSRSSVTARSWLTVAHVKCPRHPCNETDPTVLSHPLAHPSQASVLLPVPPHQVQWNYTNYGGGVLREIPSPPPLPPLCLQNRYERVDERGERDFTYEQKRKRKRGYEKMAPKDDR